MTRTLVEVGVLVAIIVGGLYAYGEVQARDARHEAERERLESRVEAAQSALASRDSAARLRVATLNASMDSLEREASRLDTVLIRETETVVSMIPDSVRPAVEQLMATCRERIGVCEERADSLESVVFVKDGQLASRDSVLTAQDSLVTELQDQLDPPFWESLMGDLPDTALKVGLGLVGGLLVGG